MARLIVTPCSHCGAPLELDAAGSALVRCPFCGTENRVQAHTPGRPELADKQPNGCMLLGGILGGLALFVAAALTLGWWSEKDNADHVLRLGEVEGATPVGHVGATRAALMRDGSLWVACQHDLLCGVGASGQWLGSIRLPEGASSDWSASTRYGPTRGMAADSAGRLYVSYDRDLLEVSIAERRVVGPVAVLREGEAPRCLAFAPDDSLFVMTSEDDLVQLDAARTVRARWPQPLLRRDPRHHGCDTLVLDGAGQVWVTPESVPAIYVFTPSGELVRRHTPGGHGHFMGLAVLTDGSVVTGYVDQLQLLGPDFTERVGPLTSRRPGWAEVAEVLRTPDDTLVVATMLGTIARWERISGRW